MGETVMENRMKQKLLILLLAVALLFAPLAAFAADGDLIIPPFDASNFYGTEGMTWTVEEADVKTFAYMIDPGTKKMTIWFVLNRTSLSGTPSAQVNIKIPANKVSAIDMDMFTVIIEGPTTNRQVGTCGANDAEGYNTFISISKNDMNQFVLGTNNFYARGTAVLAFQ